MATTLSTEMNSVKIHENEIVDCLEKAATDLATLSREGTQIGVLSQDVKESFDSLDPALPFPLKLRYLLLHAYEGLESNPRLYERWLEVLEKHGVSGEVLHKVKGISLVPTAGEVVEGGGGEVMVGGELVEGGGDEVMVGGEVGDDVMESGSAEVVGGGGGEVLEGVAGKVMVGAKRPRSFLEWHVSALIKILGGYSYKWKDICIFLNLPTGVRKNIEHKCFIDGNSVCFTEALHQWIVGGHEHAKSPTVENLEAALTSVNVGLGDVANVLQESLAKHGICFVDETALPRAKRPRFDPLPLEIIHQSCDTQVADDKSTVLEVQAVAARGATISYQWMKGGFPLRDGKYYLGASRQMLCIKNAILAYNGVYMCKIHAESDHAVIIHSKPIVLTVAVSPPKKVLVDMYSSQPEVQEDSWPPVCHTYINLALIEQNKKLEASDEFSRYTIKGGMDDIRNKKESIKYEEAFGEYKSGCFVLIEGRPGSGKTTLVHKISKDWANGKPILRGAKLVFLISLRVLANRKGIQLLDLLDFFYHDHRGKAIDIQKQLNDSNGEGACFIIDGLDEYSSKEDDSIVFRLIHKRYLQRSMVIVASRPVATGTLRNKAGARIEVVGFLRDQIYEYVDTYPFAGSGNKSESLKLYLSQHLNILLMCYLPVHAAMISFLHDRMKGGSLPLTESGIYKHFIMLTLRRKVSQKERSASLKSVDALGGDSFHNICKLAFDMTTSSVQVFKEDELLLSDSCNSDEPALGLVTIDSSAGLYGLQKLYTFVHLTFQEYLAAYYISKLSEEELTVVMREHGGKTHMKVVWKFFCSLVSFKDQESIFKKVLSMYNDRLYHCQCAFESQQSTACTCVLPFKSELSVKNLNLIPSDFIAIGYVIKNSSILEKLELSFCPLDNANIFAFANTLKLCSSSLKHLSLRSSHLDDCGIKTLASDFNNLQTIDLISNDIGDVGARVLADSLKCYGSFKSLNLHNNKIGGDGVRALCDFLKNCSNMQELSLGYNKIGDDGAKIISDNLKRWCNLESLNLMRNRIGDRGVQALSDSIKNKHCPELKVLNLESTEMSEESAKCLGESLKHCSKLESLLLSENDIGTEGVRSLAKSIEHCSELITLELEWTEMNDESAKDLAKGLKQCSKLEKLCLAHNEISDDGVKHLAEVLKETSITFLDLRYNCIENEGAASLGKCLKYCYQLTALHLEHNEIGDEGIKGLSEGLKHCFDLCTLSLDGNKLHNEGAKDLAKCLKHCTRLGDLFLKHNRIGDEGAEVLIAALRHCSSLSGVYIDGNQVSEEVAARHHPHSFSIYNH